MPIPKPENGETKEKFIERCMADAAMTGEYEDRDQRYAVCIKQWEQANMAGFDEEIAIFRAGEYPQGTISEADLDDVVRDYDPAVHEAPVVVGHPTHNNPAFGWVDCLRREGKLLLARLKDVVPEFADVVKNGLYKKRSASFLRPHQSPTGRWYLNHIGFLGAKAPQVKGLKDIGFADARYRADIDFEEEEAMETLKKEQVHKMIDDAVNKARDETRAEFQDTINTLKKENIALQNKVKNAEERAAKVAADAARKETAAFCEDLIRQGRLMPAMRDAGLVEFMMSLDPETTIVNFAEMGKDPEKLAPRSWMKRFLESLPPLVNFGRIIPGDGDAGTYHAEFTEKGEKVDPERAALHRKALNYQEQHQGVSYEQALAAVTKR